MANFPNLDQFADEDKPKSKKRVAKSPVAKKNIKVDNPLFNLVVITIIILGIIGVVFGYTKDKLSQVSRGGDEKTQQLASQVEQLKNDLKQLGDKANSLEQANQESKEIVLSVFEKERKLPTNVKVEGWSTYVNDQAKLSLRLPTDWEVASTATETKPVANDKSKTPATVSLSTIILQPKANPAFAGAITIKDDYPEFANLSVAEKFAHFKALTFLDTQDVSFGKLLYFIDLDAQKNQVPTIIVLTDKRILRCTFNIFNKELTSYIKYRKDFENIISTLDFAVVSPVPAIAPAVAPEAPKK